MEFNRIKGVDQGAWILKKHVVVPDTAEMHKRALPEEVCLAESMQVGLRHLQDAGYGQAASEAGGAGDDDSKLDIEQQLAPWITTKNFINATANKAMLKLFGEGDPTGRGEAFSFLRVSMKDIFLRAGEEMATRLGQSPFLSLCPRMMTDGGMVGSSNGGATQVSSSVQRPRAARRLQGRDPTYLARAVRQSLEPRRAAVDRGGRGASEGEKEDSSGWDGNACEEWECGE